MTAPDPVELTAALIRCPSVTPVEGGALVLLEGILSAAGFECHRVDRNGTPNLFARWGARGHPRTFGFNGHTDVVPVGDEAAWTVDPFGGEIRDGRVWGRGACDMKSGVAAFVAAAVGFVQETPPDGAVILTITGDEEGASEDGTVALLDWMREKGETMTVCVVGEPTCQREMGDMIKIGRRGVMTAHIHAAGTQGHAAYPHRAKNPLDALVAFLHELTATPLDTGTAHFDPTSVAITTIDAGNPTHNVIPAKARATVNIRFNDTHTGASITRDLQALADRVVARTGVALRVETRIAGEAFLTPPGALSDLASGAMQAETNRSPELSTSGGSSDARFVKDICPVVEVGLVGTSLHQVDEYAETAQIEALTRVYRRMLAGWFA